MVEPACAGERRIERILTGMAERRVPEGVRQAQGFGEVLVQAERPSDGPADLRYFEAVGQTDTVVIPVGGDEDLGLVAQAAERHRVDQPVAIALENVARTARPAVVLMMKPAARVRGTGGD